MKRKVPKPAPPEAADEEREDVEIPCQAMSPLEVASFIEGMTGELRAMARDAKLSALSYFLEMARIEACAEVERLASPSSERH